MRTLPLQLPLLGLLLLQCGCRKAPEVPECCKEPGTPAEAADTRSLHLLESTWRDTLGSSVRLEDLPGTVRIVTLIYTTCEYACPATLADLRKFEAAIPRASLPNVHFVLVSMDPERDTPGVLAEYAKNHGLAAERWTLLQGSTEATRELAAVLGFRFKKVGAGFTHSNAVYALDRRGVVVATASGQPLPAELLSSAIERAISNR